MSTNQSQLFGVGGRFLTDPRHFAKCGIARAILKIKDAAGTVVDSSAAGFFTNGAFKGSQASVVTANVFVSVLNYSAGGGIVTNCVSPNHTGAATPSIRITVDGGTPVTIAPTANFAAAQRLVLGAITAGLFTATGDSTYANSASDNGFAYASVGGISQITGAGVPAGLISPEEVIGFGWQGLRFEQSILIEMACSGISANAVDKQGLVLWVAD